MDPSMHCINLIALLSCHVTGTCYGSSVTRVVSNILYCYLYLVSAAGETGEKGSVPVT